MQTKFELSQSEVQEAVQAFIAKHQRSRNLKVSAVEWNAETNSVTVGAEVEVKPAQPRKARTPKAKAKQA